MGSTDDRLYLPHCLLCVLSVFLFTIFTTPKHTYMYVNNYIYIKMYIFLLYDFSVQVVQRNNCYHYRGTMLVIMTIHTSCAFYNLVCVCQSMEYVYVRFHYGLLLSLGHMAIYFFIRQASSFHRTHFFFIIGRDSGHRICLKTGQDQLPFYETVFLSWERKRWSVAVTVTFFYLRLDLMYV